MEGFYKVIEMQMTHGFIADSKTVFKVCRAGLEGLCNFMKLHAGLTGVIRGCFEGV